MFHFYNDHHPLLPWTYTLPGELGPGMAPPLHTVPVSPRLGEDGQPLPGEWPCANATRTDWDYAVDHRQRKDAQGQILAGTGTAYWLPGDDWQSPARYMEDIGPLPQDALLAQPQKPAPTAQELATRLRHERDSRITATDYLMMPDYPIADATSATVAAYRQSLRDMPALRGFPWDGGGEGTPWPDLPPTLEAKRAALSG